MQKIIVFGDVHGCLEAAEKAIEIAKEKNYRAIFLGDYVDRGPKSAETLLKLNKAKEENKDWVFLKGNHESMVLDLLEGRNKSSDMGEIGQGKFSYKQSEKTFTDINNLSINEKEKCLNFLQNLKLYHEEEQWIFCHAVLLGNGKPIDKKTEEELLWNYDYNPLWKGKRFVHGHLPIAKLIIEKNYININTGCGYNGFLTGLVINPIQKNPLEYYEITEDGNIISNT